MKSNLFAKNTKCNRKAKKPAGTERQKKSAVTTVHKNNKHERSI